MMEGFAGLVVISVFMILWFLPWLIAWNRGHRNTVAIFFVTLLFSWTIIGWFAAFIWAFTNPPDAVVMPSASNAVVVNNGKSESTTGEETPRGRARVTFSE